ncbi:hypothetical protein ANCCAN_12133 [Ancylostoma caninum]|uniref:N-acetyltransferase ESCO acetyl-transferase domain-containing protein n=1 Tax=Ancylostoma caninum TaxID=29170 RepID=A0A368GF89_ANCCA|nr:hypothetical protein ANCCAN_12133 [Ancylostoma caninum]
MQKQKRVTDFFSSPIAKKSPNASPRTPLFELDTQLAVAKKSRNSLCETDARQAILDAGQRKIGGHYCKQCDMMYCIDSITEVAMHDKHHNKYSDVRSVKISPSQLNLWLRRECCYPTDRGHVFRISPDSQSSLKRRAEQIIEDLVNTSVGFSPDLSIWGWEKRRTVWVSVLTEGSFHFIAGVIITEPLESAQYSNSGEELRDGEPIVGVNRIWTHPTARRKGVASELLDVIRHRYFTGILVPKSRIAFSDPSDDGKKFAEQYVGNTAEQIFSFLVYTELRDGEPIVGVNRIWTHPTARRKGVASELLDVIRHRYFTGILVPKSRIAFSDPSDDGKKFAEQYVGNTAEQIFSFLVYTVTK